MTWRVDRERKRRCYRILRFSMHISFAITIVSHSLASNRRDEPTYRRESNGRS